MPKPKKAPRENLNPLEPSYCHLPSICPHTPLQKVRGWLGGFCERRIAYSSNGSRTANSVKRILSPFNVTSLTSKSEGDTVYCGYCPGLKRIIGCANHSNPGNPGWIEYVIPITIFFYYHNIPTTQRGCRKSQIWKNLIP